VKEPEPIPFLSFIRKRIVKKSIRIAYGIFNRESYELATIFLGKKAMKEWYVFFMDMKVE